MADNRADTRVSMRTPLSRVKGLGAAHHGVEHWRAQRLTAIANIPLIIGFVGIVATLAWRPWAEAVAVVQNPFVAIVLGLAIISVTNHMRWGMQIVVDDYVHAAMPKFVIGVVNTFFTIAIMAVGLFALLKISFGRLPLPPV